MKHQFSIVEGVVQDTSDPQQMGRLKVWCPALDGSNYTIENLPWVNYVSPLAGQTLNYPAGSEAAITPGFMSYGLWAIPKVGAQVLVAILYSDVNIRYYLGSVFGDHGNRSLPVGRNRPDLGNQAPISDTFDPVEPQTSYLKAQFNGNLSASEAQTRGAYERQVAMDQDNRDGSEGYQKGALEDGLDPQTYCLVTPGRHAIIMQDNPSTGRMRLKTANGHQVIMDDANERIYVSTNQGKSWLEMDADGHIHMYGAASFSVSSGADINLSATGNINLSAGGNLNLSSGGSTAISGCDAFSISGGTLNMESTGVLNLKAAAEIIISGSTIDLNGPEAEGADCPAAPSIVPDHEPWSRPASTSTRGKNWKA